MTASALTARRCEASGLLVRIGHNAVQHGSEGGPSAGKTILAQDLLRDCRYVRAMAPPDLALFVFHVGPARLAVDATRIRRVLPLLPLERPPSLPVPVAGFMTLHGVVLPVLATAVVLGLTQQVGTVDAYAHIMVPDDLSERSPALLVDRVEGRVLVPDERVGRLGTHDSLNGTVVGEVMLLDGPAHLVSLDRLLTSAERAQVEALTLASRKREALWTASAQG